MQLKAGDRVTHPGMPKWGLGQLLADPSDNIARVFFVGAGEKAISLDHVSLMLVTGAAAVHPLLDNLPHPDAALRIRYRSLPDSIASFLKKYPGGFYGQTFLDQEREYKVKAHELCRSLLSKGALSRLLASHDSVTATRDALRVVNATNLIFPNEKMALRDGLADLASQARFAESLFALLHDRGDLEAGFRRFADMLNAIGAAKWTIATYFPFLFDPQRNMFLKPTVTQNAAEICRFGIDYKPELNWHTYERVQAFARYLRVELAELKPRDMIDVQSFMWCIAPD